MEAIPQNPKAYIIHYSSFHVIFPFPLISPVGPFITLGGIRCESSKASRGRVDSAGMGYLQFCKGSLLALDIIEAA